MVRLNCDAGLFNRDHMFQSLRQTGELFDVTLACEDSQVEVHKVILAATSDVLQKILIKNSSPHPVIFLRGTRKNLLDNVVDFMYKGYVEVKVNDLEDFTELVADLQIRGLEPKELRKFIHGEKNDVEKSGVLKNITKPQNCEFCEAPLSSDMSEIWFHYSLCYYNEGALFEKMPPGPHNSDAAGRPVDEIGVDVLYNCDEMHCCYTGKNLGYKEFLLHQAMCHRILEEVIVENREGHVPELLQIVHKAAKQQEFRFRAECFNSKIKSLKLGQQKRRRRR